ncbi:PaaI family thioesterase [Archaeoglobus neptunius]|uniref:PaaI family thioesterase n=1 Tax=Archaeoglobus neptunius TaxID=2798580 RepID=UPI001925B406|nr:PaaI family thioesterase [Archaeoglobus neptunius]
MDGFENVLNVVGSAPWYRLTGMVPKLQGDRIIVEMRIEKNKHVQALGMAHGGAIASVLDSAIGLNVNREVVKIGKTAVTAQLNIHYIRPVTEGKVVGVGMPMNIGGKVAVGYGEVRNENGDLIATGTATFYITDRKFNE